MEPRSRLDNTSDRSANGLPRSKLIQLKHLSFLNFSLSTVNISLLGILEHFPSIGTFSKWLCMLVCLCGHDWGRMEWDVLKAYSVSTACLELTNTISACQEAATLPQPASRDSVRYLSLN